jgi:hypothetical protein
MITIDTDTIWDIALLDDIARTVLGVDTVGVSVGAVSSIHLVNEAQAVQDMAQAIFDGYNVLSVTAEATGQALTCTCDDPAIANDAELGYLVLRDGAVYATDLVAVTDGSASITLVDPIAGVYDLIMYRVVGDYRSAVAGLVVHEATA